MRRVGKIGRQKVFSKVKNVNVESLKIGSKLLDFLHTLANPIIIASYGRKYFQLHRNPRCTFFIPLPSSFSSSLPSSFPLFFHLLHFSFHHLIFLSSLDILLYLEVSHADIYRLWKAFRKKGEKIWCFDNSLSSLLSSPLFPQPKSAQFSFKKRKSGGKMLDLSTGSEKQMML